MNQLRGWTRRGFMGVSAAAAAPLILPHFPYSPNDRITVGLIGAGSRGLALLGGFLKDEEFQVVAVCDVASNRKYGARYGYKPAVERVDQHYAKQTGKEDFKVCKGYKDYREVCARENIDAVVVATPDHWHTLVALEAIRNGKDIYCEKPVTHLLGEGRLLCEEVRKHKRVWQTGSQQRSEWNFLHAVELVRNGVIGKLERVEVGLPAGKKSRKVNTAAQNPPATLDYDFWCGPSKKLPYMHERLHFHWRWNLAYGGGQLMDWIGHHNDIAHWGMDMDRSGPVEVEAYGFEYPENKVPYDAPLHYGLRCAYANGVNTTLSTKNMKGTKWIGSDGWVYVDRKKLSASNKAWVQKTFDPGPVKVYASPGHVRNFKECIRSRKDCVAPVETSFRSITPGFLAYISDALGRKIKWDPEMQVIVGDDEATKLTEVSYRAPWKLPS